MREFPLNIRNAEQLKATLGVSLTVYDKLIANFERYIELEQRLRFLIWMYGEGKKKTSQSPLGKLPTAPLQAVFVLYYLKNYILMETFAERFNMDKGTTIKLCFRPRITVNLPNWTYSTGKDSLPNSLYT